MKQPILTLVTFILMSAVLAGCEQEADEAPKPVISSFKNDGGNQKVNIVHAQYLYEDYLEKLEQTPRQERQALYEEKILKPIEKECFTDLDYPHMAKEIQDYQVNKFPGTLKKVINSMNKEHLDSLIKEALEKSSGILPSTKDINVCVFPTDNSFHGTMVATGAGRIIFYYSNYNSSDRMIKSSISHEYHHSAWTEQHFESSHQNTVLDNLVFEGKAVMFEETVYPGMTSIPLDTKAAPVFWNKVRDDLNKTDLNRSLEVLYGGGPLPSNYGYSEGYKIVKAYIEETGNDVKEWTAASPDEILKKGRYIERYYPKEEAES
ncbi:DUF2268 domain-containing protein [Bacillus infantis]|uniref:DUF2268 domain-containing protein n=1 Tax=Bacillus infantis TaxID=324767 RepID=UPI0021558BC2|nr:DUF2268 domain-containing protein [Bacillus infantis]MCR6609175.1 DUF2268 domain-containing protein [Bacillus infantis]